MNLTPKQLHILTRIRDQRVTHGYSPTMQELADELGVSKVTVFEHVEALIRKGALLREANKARSLALAPGFGLPHEQRPTRLPMMGSIAAGHPIEAVEDNEYLDLEELFVAGSKRGSRGHPAADGLFVLRVTGDSMIDEQIRDGDHVVIQPCDQPRNGQTVVALLDDGEATLKKFYREKNRIRLQPANDRFEPIYVDRCKVQGVVVGVIRTY